MCAYMYNYTLFYTLFLFIAQVQEEDRNQDGKSDFLNLQINIPLKPEEQMFSIQLLLTFSYQLFVCIQYIHIYITICLSVFCNLNICLSIHVSIYLEEVYCCHADACICSAFLISTRFSAVHQCRSKASPANSSSSQRGVCCLQCGCLWTAYKKYKADALKLQKFNCNWLTLNNVALLSMSTSRCKIEHWHVNYFAFTLKGHPKTNSPITKN